MRWRLATQDYTHHKHGIGAPRPEVVVRDYDSAEAAEAAKRVVRADAARLGRDVAACVTPIGLVVRRTGKKPMADTLGGLPVRRKQLTR